MEDELKELMKECMIDAKEISYETGVDSALLAIELFRERLKKKNPSHR